MQEHVELITASNTYAPILSYRANVIMYIGVLVDFLSETRLRRSYKAKAFRRRFIGVSTALLPPYTTSRSHLSFVNKRRSWCCVSCSFLVEESNSAPAIAGATSQGSGAALNAGSRFLAIPGNPGKPLFCRSLLLYSVTHLYIHELHRAR